MWIMISSMIHQPESHSCVLPCHMYNICVCCRACTWSEHLLSHEQVIETADVVPARQENQDCPFLSEKDVIHSAAERYTKTSRASEENNTKHAANRNKQPLAGGAWATTEPSEQGARVVGGAEPRQIESTRPELPTPTFTRTTGPDTACQHHYDTISAAILDSLCFTLPQEYDSILSQQQIKKAN